jgi:DOPA 4,5-dioxygenase
MQRCENRTQAARIAKLEKSQKMPATIDPQKIHGYHAHIYYDPNSRKVAAGLRRKIEHAFKVEMGRWRDEPVGPHPQAMYQVKFKANEFKRIVPWLMLNRAGLAVLVHPETGDDYEDHATHALWLGAKLALRLDVLKELLEKFKQSKSGPSRISANPSQKTAGRKKSGESR